MDAAGEGPSNDYVSAHTGRHEQNEFRETPRNSLEIKQFCVWKPRVPVALVALAWNFPSTVGRAPSFGMAAALSRRDGKKQRNFARTAAKADHFCKLVS